MNKIELDLRNRSRIQQWPEKQDETTISCVNSHEKVLKTAYTSPLGHLLRIISVLPEIRHEKVDRARENITAGRYDSDDNLNEAIDKVLEELITGN